MASELAMVISNLGQRRIAHVEFICPQCGPCCFDIHTEGGTKPKQIKFAVDLVFKAHQLEHK